MTARSGDFECTAGALLAFHIQQVRGLGVTRSLTGLRSGKRLPTIEMINEREQ